MAHARCRSVRQSLLIMCVLYGIVQANLVGNELFHAAAVTNSTVVYGEQYVTAVNATFRTTKDEPCIRGDGTDILPRKDWCCDCWNTAPNIEEVHCRCTGLALQRISQNLPVNTSRMSIVLAQLLKLRVLGLKRYANALQDLTLADVPNFETIESGALSQCKQLRTLYISQAPRLTQLPEDVFVGVPETFRSLRIINSGLKRVPVMSHLSPNVILHMVDLEGNKIERIDEHSVLVKTEQFILDSNRIEYIDKAAFEGSQIAKLSIKSNYKLRHVHPAAFAGIVHVRELDLSNTALEVLPTDGLSSLEILRIQFTHSLRTIPSVYHFENLRKAWLTHSFHCCAFKNPSRHDPHEYRERQRYMLQLQRMCHDNNNKQQQMTSTIMPPLTTPWMDMDDYDNGVVGTFWSRVKRAAFRLMNGSTQNDINTFKRYNDDFGLGFSDSAHKDAITGKPILENGVFDDQYEDMRDDEFNSHSIDFGEFHEAAADITPNAVLTATCGNLSQTIIVLDCYPKPDALNPCEDVMGAQWLRISVWVVVTLAVVGNVAVLVVTFSYCKSLTVTKFLIGNLAFADLCLGLYLLLLATIDLRSIGEYFNYGFEWQYGFGCKAAGFLSVLASHLSVFSLCIITLERCYAITNAMYPNKRIRMRQAVPIMLGGWLYSVLMSALPLFGFSNYSSTSICLPMETRDGWDSAYLALIIGNTGVAFGFIAACYGQIYKSLGKETRQAQRHASRMEMTVAKKMALLVFTNFACWAPIAFFGLTALAGYPFIDVAKSKILLVFFYPLNSCADPYLYAILTVQYRRDFFGMLGRCGLWKEKARRYRNEFTNNNTQMLVTHTQVHRLSASTAAASRKASRDVVCAEEFV